MTYRPSEVTVDVKANPRIASLGEALRIPCLIGMGPTTITVTDEAVSRGTGSVDHLSNYPDTGVSVTQIAKRSGLLPGSLDYNTGSSGSLYSASAYSGGSTGIITWTSAPTMGTVYYVSYTKPVEDSNFQPQILVDKSDLINAFGAEDNSTGILTVAGSIVLENKSPAVMVVQVGGGTTFNQTNYFSTIDALLKKERIEDLIILFPTGSVGPTRAQQEAVLAYAFQHVQYASQITVKKERGLGCGSPALEYCNDGFDTLGDPTVNGSYLGRAAVLKSENVFYIAPSTVSRVSPSGTVLQLDGNFAACAVAGVRAAQALRATPIHGMQVVGIDIPEDKWTDPEMDILGGGNCLVLEKHGGIITIRDALTTDDTSAETTELSIPAVKRLVKRALRTTIKNTYLNKGLVITSDILGDIEGTVQTTMLQLINQGEIRDYGKKSDPDTGEVPIRAIQDTLEPRRVKVTCSISYAFPLKFVAIVVYPFV